MADEPFFRIDYTSRDYTSIRQDLIDLIPALMPEWTSRSANDFGMTLLELWAYVADNLHYYADRVANEAYIETALEPDSVLQIARQMDYTPVGNVAATVNVLFSNTTASAVTVPAGTQLSSSNPTAASLIFETNTSVTVPALGTASVLATEGRTVTEELVGTSTGQVDQTYPLFESPVLDGSLKLLLAESVVSDWRYVPNLVVARPGDPFYTTSRGADGRLSVIFGDNANGKIPEAGVDIRVTYRVGGGTVGNVAAGSITRIVSGSFPGITVANNEPAVGGANAESITSVRLNAPRSLRSLTRAVSLADYASLAVSVPGVGKANATSAGNAVTVYVAPAGGGGLVSGSPTTSFTALKNTVLAYLNERKLLTTTVSVGNPTYVGIDITVTVYALDSHRQERVQADVSAALKALLDFDNVYFEDKITATDVHRAVLGVPGVQYVEIPLLARSGGSGLGPALLTAAEIPVAGSITANVIGGI